MKLTSKFYSSVIALKRNTVPVDDLEPIACENCGHQFKGHFCPNCGQEVAEFNRPIGFVVYDFLGNFFAFDTRFLKTFKYLLFRPGYLTVEFFQGHRMRYSPPFRNFVFLSFILFILLQSLTERSLDQSLDIKESANAKPVDAGRGIELRANYFLGSDSAEVSTGKAIAGSSIAEKGQTEANNKDVIVGFTLDELKKGNIRDKLNKLADDFQEKLDKSTDPEERKVYRSYITMCRAPEMVISNIMKYLSWSFFILLPLFALILKLFYLRRKQFYIRHLIFSIHLHSYLFFLLIIITSLKLLFDSGLTVINGILMLAFPVYFIVALHRFYGQSYGKVIAKMIGISAVYNIFLWAAVILVFMKSFIVV